MMKLFYLLILILNFLIFSENFSLKKYNASINDSLIIFTSADLFGPQGTSSITLSDKRCSVSESSGNYIFFAGALGLFTVVLKSRSSGSEISDTVLIEVTNKKPIIIITKKNVYADINKTFNPGFSVKDDGNSINVLFDFFCDGTIDTLCTNQFEPNIRLTIPTRCGENSKKINCAITVIDNDSNKTFDTVTIYLKYNPPTAIVGNNIIVCAYQKANISALLSNDPNGYINTFIWDLNGDGIADTTLANPKIDAVFNTHGDFCAILRVCDNDGNISKPDSLFITVMSDKPTVRIGASDTVKVGESILFCGRGNSNCGEIERYLWDFDNNNEWDYTSRKHGQTKHIYKNAGFYLAKFMVIDNSGVRVSKVREIIVLP